ncbi:MAG: hypothetical protein DRP08_08040 [Candidatus Aenigmatarchaeota archaeon]|nr:MAG: hypothetical protein DRP08_08040 [Candidatus Aenigmarchaeota archaeon]
MRKVLIFGLIVISFFFLTSVASAWWNENWQYRREITVANTNNDVLTDYQVLVILNETNFNFSHASSNGSDIRFVDGDDSTELSYWIEEWNTSSQTAKIWVKVPHIPANSSVEIYIYYGNPTVASASDGSAVFEFFDDFEDGDVSDWVQVYTGTLEASTEQAKHGSYSLKITSTSSSDAIHAERNFNYSSGVLTVWFYDHDPNLDENFWVKLKNSADYTVVCGVGKNEKVGYYSYRLGTTWHSTGISRSRGWHKVTFVVSGSSVKIYFDDEYQAETTSANDISGISLGWIWATISEYYDTVLVRKYASVEPSVTIGAEERYEKQPSASQKPLVVRKKKNDISEGIVLGFGAALIVIVFLMTRGGDRE